MLLNEITPLVLVFNEEANLHETLRRLDWASEVVVLDSSSTDDTSEIAASFENVRFVSREFDNHTNQWNFGLSLIETNWVLALDADYKCSASLSQELVNLQTNTDVYLSKFRYCVFGKALRATLYPKRAVLFRTDKFEYVQDGHTQLLQIGNSKAAELESIIDHDDRKPLSRWLTSQFKYAALESEKLLGVPAVSLGWKDRIRLQVLFAPILTLIYCLFVKGLLLDGWSGIFYSLQRVFAEMLLSLVLLDRKLRGICDDVT